MVDPNRKINRLTDDDAAFLRECEDEFRNRYTVNDEEFVAFCEKPSRDPPIISPWQTGGNRPNNQNQWRNNRGGGGGVYNNRGNYNQHHNRNRGNEYVHRGPRHFGHNRNRQYDRNDRNYQRPDGNNYGGGRYGDRGGQSHHDRPYHQRP